MKKEKRLGSTSPWAWVIEPVHGCNLRCGHCSCRLLPSGKYTFMTEDVWRKTWEIIAYFTPACRIDLVLAGEPTLHPDIYNFLKIARKISPSSQIQITINGAMLLKEVVTYEKLLNSGANIIYTDMYGDKNRFIELAQKSKFTFYEYYNKPENALSPWTYHHPFVKMIVLQEQPENWPVSRKRAGLLGTWMNHLDWEAAKKFNLYPVLSAPNRRCNQPFIYVPVCATGEYLLYCQDNWHETAGVLGSVLSGKDGFLKYWYSKKLQEIRQHLRNKNRNKVDYCSRCNITFSRCDFKHWDEKQLAIYWSGKKWCNL